jgi:hypothetical protein
MEGPETRTATVIFVARINIADHPDFPHQQSSLEGLLESEFGTKLHEISGGPVEIEYVLTFPSAAAFEEMRLTLVDSIFGA